MGKDSDQIRREIEETRERMGDTVEAIGYKADVPSRVKENINDRVEGVKQSMRSGIQTITGAVSGTTDKLGDAASDARHRLGDSIPDTGDLRRNVSGATSKVVENPLGLAIGAAALGFLAGLALPATEIEKQRLGPLTDGIAEKVQSAGSGLVEHGKQVLQETAQTAMQSGKDHAQQVAQTFQSGNGDTASKAAGTTSDFANRKTADMSDPLYER